MAKRKAKEQLKLEDLAELPRKPKPESLAREPAMVTIRLAALGTKRVTQIHHLDDHKLLGKLRKSLGTGGTDRGSHLELHGDQRQRAAEWLKQRGYKVFLVQG